MAEGRTILVTGATGKQGGAAARQLLDAGYDVRALTRDPKKESAEELRSLGAEVVEGDLDDRASLERAVEGAYGVFSVQNFWETGYDREVEQGVRMADVAADAGVEHFVYSSVGGAERNTGIPHFDSKYEIEEHVRSLDMPYTTLRPVFFMNNWEADMFKNMVLGGTLAQPLSPDTPFQQIDVDDIGAFVALAFDNPSVWIGRELEIAGDERTMEEIARTFSDVIGRDVNYHQVPWDDFREQAGEEYAVMYRWFEDEGYEADVESLSAEHPDLVAFDDYLVAHGWKDAASIWRAQSMVE